MLARCVRTSASGLQIKLHQGLQKDIILCYYDMEYVQRCILERYCMINRNISVFLLNGVGMSDVSHCSPDSAGLSDTDTDSAPIHI